LPFDRSRSWKGTPVHFFEAIIGRVEGEAARYAHGDADSSAFKFDCKSLVNHDAPRGEQ
jgi:hypothetical protein